MNLNKILSAITKTKLNGCVLFCCRPLLLTLCVHGHRTQLAAGCHHSADPVTATPSATLTLHDSQVDVPTKKGWRDTVGDPWCGPFYRKVTYQRIEGKTLRVICWFGSLTGKGDERFLFWSLPRPPSDHMGNNDRCVRERFPPTESQTHCWAAPTLPETLQFVN